MISPHRQAVRRVGRAWWLVVAAPLLAVGMVPLQGATARATDPRFGLIESHDAPARADELAVAWERARFHWALVQPNGPNEWVEAELTAAELAGELSAGREVIGLLIGIPDWARDSNGLPRGLYLPPDEPGNLWAGFVREAVTRYRGQIDHWIIWNEPDVWDPQHPAYTWPGDVHDYVRLLKVAYVTAKAANPDSVIHLAAMSHWWDVRYGRDLYFPQLLDAILADPDAAASGYFYDVATLHLYFNPASVYEIVQQYYGFQAERGIERPIWLIETNAAPSSDPAWPVAEPAFQVSLLEQAAYMPQALPLALAAGAERVGIYKLIDTSGDYAANPEPFGLVRADDSPRPAFRTAQIAMETLAGANQLWWNEQHVVSQVIVEKPGQVIRILWSRVPQAQVITVPALSTFAMLMDMWGNTDEAVPRDGVYRLQLFAGECQETAGDYCMIGGPPLYLIENMPADSPSLRQDDLPTILAYEPLSPLEPSARPDGAGWWALVVCVVVVVAFFELVLKRRLVLHARSSTNEQER